ncbi:DUF6750 family protein [Pseudomonas fulva]|uniref:DUF6750 family protein n=1 Tax=Pseudomonas fulva TaxID=47880 RepID=UPI002DBA9B37|nr:DUF6750 family protein [Pseudomonas fulva]MEB8059270.1 conjugal transfer protein TraR [Pseudomonas fulva]
MLNKFMLGLFVRAELAKDKMKSTFKNGVTALAAVLPTAAFADGDIADMFDAGATGSESALKSILKIAQLVGVVFVIGSFIAMKNKKDNPQIKTSHIVAGLLTGVILIVIPEIIKRTQTQIGLTPVSVG